MPTGYTANVQNGSVVTLKDYASLCARAFTPLIELRDEPLTPELPDEIKTNTTYTEKRIEEDTQKLAEVRAWTEEEANNKAIEAYVTEKQRILGILDESRIQTNRYETMLAKVREWQPPSEDHISLKNFMINQLLDSIQHDSMEDYYGKALKELKPMDGSKYREIMIETYTDSLAYHEEHLAKIITRTTERNKWLQQLKESLKET